MIALRLPADEQNDDTDRWFEYINAYALPVLGSDWKLHLSVHAASQTSIYWLLSLNVLPYFSRLVRFLL